MTTLETLCAQFLEAPNSCQARQILEQIAEAFYSDPRISRILEAELRRSGLFMDRKEDLRHDVFLAFTGFVLPKLQYPDRAIGAVLHTARNCVKRLNSNRYGNENVGTLLLDDPDSTVQLEDMLGADDTQEDRIIKNMMTQRAKEAIEAALANPNSGLVKTRCWIRAGFPSKPELDGQPPRVPAKELPPAEALNTRPPRYRDMYPKKELTEAAKWFMQAKEDIGLTVKTLAQRLDILPATLRSYLDRRVNLPEDVSERMRRFVESAEGKDRQAVHSRTKDIPMPDIVAAWQKRTGLFELRALAEVLDVQRTILYRWARPKSEGGESRPHPESIYECEKKVAFYEQAAKKKAK